MKKLGFFFIGFWLIMGFSIGQVPAQTVYVTKTGEKYHSGTCHYLKYSNYSIDLEKAVEKGYTACAVCKPAKASKAATSNIPAKPLPAHSQPANATYQRCTAMTQAGTRCKRNTKDASGKCWQHEE